MATSPPHDELAARRASRSAAAAPAAAADRCSVVSVPLPGILGVMVRVAGDVDANSVAHLRVALSEAAERRPCHLIVDLAGVTSCGAQGVAALVDIAATASAHGTAYALCGASPSAAAFWWPLQIDDPLSPRYPSARVALLVAAYSRMRRRGRSRARPR